MGRFRMDSFAQFNARTEDRMISRNVPESAPFQMDRGTWHAPFARSTRRLARIEPPRSCMYHRDLVTPRGHVSLRHRGKPRRTTRLVRQNGPSDANLT